MTTADFSPYGVNLFGEPVSPNGNPLAAEFTLPPFSILDARQGEWQDRKRAWLSYGIQSEVGRDARAYNIKEWIGTATDQKTIQSDVSIFDPVLTELCYRWFCPPSGHILDPFAGGSVRGIVAGFLGRRYTGIDLRAEQVAANEAQAVAIAPPVVPRWIAGDSLDVLSHPWQYYPDDDSDLDADFVFTCPPYHDLKKYSDDLRDLSNMSYGRFMEKMRDIIDWSCNYLRDDRFAAIVVGDIRDKQGAMRNFVSHTIDAFTNAGLRYYNEVVLVTSTGTLRLRAGKQFRTSRKIGKTHQNVLVFVKGDPRKATAAFAEALEGDEEEE